MSDDDSARGRRETFLTLFLTLLGGGGFLMFLIFVSGGFFLYVLLAVVALVCFGLFHYLFWGWAMTEKTAGEREELELRDQAEADGWPLPEAQHPRHR